MTTESIFFIKEYLQGQEVLQTNTFAYLEHGNKNNWHTIWKTGLKYGLYLSLYMKFDWMTVIFFMPETV